jgi:hypothetical protein
MPTTLSPTGQSHSFLRDIGSGQGFVLPPRRFFYSGRRTYLYDNDSCPALDPPFEFMNRRQTQRLQQVAASRARLAQSIHLRQIAWIVVEDPGDQDRPLLAGEGGSRKSIYASRKSVVGGDKHGARARVRPSMKQEMATVEEREFFNPQEWELSFEAGVYFWVHLKTGECFEDLYFHGRRAAPARACLASLRLVPGVRVAENVSQQRQGRSASPAGQPDDETRDEDVGRGIGALAYDGRPSRELLGYLEGRAPLPLK